MKKTAASKVKVIESKEAPAIKNPSIQSGIRDAVAAASWGQKNGYAVVYFVARKQRVYADRLQTKVNEQARAIEQQAIQLVLFAENNQ